MLKAYADAVLRVGRRGWGGRTTLVLRRGGGQILKKGLEMCSSQILWGYIYLNLSLTKKTFRIKILDNHIYEVNLVSWLTHFVSCVRKKNEN